MAHIALKTGTAFVATFALSLAFAQPALAEEASPLDALQNLAAVTSTASTQVLDAVATLSDSAVSDVIATAEMPGVGIAFPSDTSTAISIKTDQATGVPDVNIGLPISDAAAPAVVYDGRAVGYDNGNSTSTLVVAKVDGSVQITTVLDSATAPERFDYTIGLPVGGSLQAASTGEVFVIGPEGYAVAAVQPAWAYDANGDAVPTHYEISGATLTQVVEHRSSFAYPIVADPQTLYFWWGQSIKFTKTETRTIANSADQVQVVTVFCGLIASAPGAVVCGLVAFIYVNAFAQTFKTASATGRCGQIDMPYIGIVIGGPLTWTAHVVKC
jgi:hypothetical protein